MTEYPVGHHLHGMTQRKWDSLGEPQRRAWEDKSSLSEQLCGLEGWRVEVEDSAGEKRRFIVGESTGWRPCHLEIARRNCRGGPPADKTYVSVRPLYQVR